MCNFIYLLSIFIKIGKNNAQKTIRGFTVKFELYKYNGFANSNQLFIY
jgi:hypothetical protein